MRRLPLAIAAILISSPASAQTILGYQLGIVQSAGGTFGDPINPLIIEGQDAGDAVQQIQGVQLNTTLVGNLTVDINSNSLQHGFVFGVAATQLLPFATPEEQAGLLDQQLTTLNANATYLARYTAARWRLQFGAGYNFGLNGRIPNGADGAVGAAAAGAILPEFQAGFFAFNAQTHALNAGLQYQLNRNRWDLQAALDYNYTINGLFTLAAGGLGGGGGIGGGALGAGTNIGAFIPQNVHTITPQIQYRQRLTARDTITVNANSVLAITQEALDDVDITTATTTVIVPAVPALPATLINNLTVEYTHNPNQERQFGANATATYGMRVPTDQFAIPIAGGGFRGDTIIWQVAALYRDTLPLQTRIQATAGVAQATLLLPPLGIAGNPDDFDPVVSNLQPIFNVTLQRRFNPVEVALTAGRAVGVGAFGASALIADNAALTFTHVTEWEMPLTTTVGFNVQRTKGVGAELFRNVNVNDPIVVAFNNQGAGANVQLALPLYREDPLAFDLAGTYNYAYNDLDPNDVNPDIAPIEQHVALLSLRGTFGRGAAQAAVGAGGRRDTDELDAFSADPRNGSPLITQRLLQQGAPVMERGDRPGLPPRQRRDSRQAYQQSLRQEALEREARERSDAIQGVGSYEDEEKRRLEEEKKRQERAKEEREQDEAFPDTGVALPPASPPPPPKN